MTELTDAEIDALWQAEPGFVPQPVRFARVVLREAARRAAPEAAEPDSQAGRDALDAARWRFFEQHASHAEFRLNKEPNTPKWATITAKFDRVYGLGNGLRDFFDAAMAAAGRGE